MNSPMQLVVVAAVLCILQLTAEVDAMKIKLPSFRKRRPGNKPGRARPAPANGNKMPVYLQMNNGNSVPVFPLPGSMGQPVAGAALHTQDRPTPGAFSPHDNAAPAGVGVSKHAETSFGQPENIQAKLSSMMPADFDEGVFAKDFGGSLPDFPDLSSIFDDSASFSSRLDAEDREQPQHVREDVAAFQPSDSMAFNGAQMREHPTQLDQRPQRKHHQPLHQKPRKKPFVGVVYRPGVQRGHTENTRN